jgi:hypothetical protein
MEAIIGITPWMVTDFERQVRSPTLKTFFTNRSKAANGETGKIRAPCQGAKQMRLCAAGADFGKETFKRSGAAAVTC